MLIRLLPASPNPSVLFNISFEDLPDGLNLPQTWTTHLSNLVHDELPMPRHQHALDKASFLPCILEEVVFDIPALSVRCRFIDGSIEHWKINLEGSEGWIGVKCMKTLESVVDDVCLSTLESEREIEREREREREKEKERLRMLQQTSPSSSKSTKHKKKRSLLMTIVSGLSSLNSIINLSLPSPTISTRSVTTNGPSRVSPAPSPSPSISRPQTPPPQNVCPRLLRRRARSSLVDAFRLYVLYELSQRVPQGGYYVWALHSLLKEARERQNAFLARERDRERLRFIDPPPPYQPPTSPSTSMTSSSSSSSTGSGSAIIFGRRRSHLKHTRGPSIEAETFSPTTASEPPPSDDEEEASTLHGHTGTNSEETNGDAETIETETDGSSIHTPSSSHFTLPSSSSLPSTPASQDLPSLLAFSLVPVSRTRAPISSYPPVPPSNPIDLQIQTLTHLILLHNSHSARTAHDEATRLDALEIRGRRRAWLNRALCANGLRSITHINGRRSSAVQRVEIGMGAGHGGLGFAVPIRRSGLGMWVVNADHLHFEQEQTYPPGNQMEGETSIEQMDAIMLEEDEVQLVGGERFNGYDERNGVEPKRTKVIIPSKGAQLFPVNEVEEEDGSEFHIPSRRSLSEPPESADPMSDDDDSASIKFENINLNQYDDLQGLQMDLDIATGVGFDLMDSSDEEGDPDSELKTNLPHSPTTSGNAENDLVEGSVPEGGLCVTFDIPKPKALHARAPHLLSGHEQRQRQRQRQRTNAVMPDQEHSVHDCSYPAGIPQRSPTPTPQFPPPCPSELLNSSPVTSTIDSMPVIKPISVPQPAYLRASTTTARNSRAPSPPHGDTAFQPCLATKPDFESRIRTSAVPENLCPHALLADPDYQGVRVNEMGELVAGKTEMNIAFNEGLGEEFTLAMDLPSKSLTSRFTGMTFASMGRTQSFRGRVRGALRTRDSNTNKSEGGISVVLEEVENGSSW